MEVNLLHPAPGTFRNTIPVRTGTISVARLGYSGSFDDFGPVAHTVWRDGERVRNQTLPTHRLHPGYVLRIVGVMGKNIVVRAIGEGTGALGEVNEAGAKALWNGIVNVHLRYRLSLRYRQVFR